MRSESKNRIKSARTALSVLLWLCAAGCASRHARSDDTPIRYYTNPVYAASMPDPSVIRYGGYYYAAGTTGAERKPDGRIFTLLRSRNLIDWEELGGALTPPFTDPGLQYWAPELTSNNGRYYLYYAVSGNEPEKFAIRVS